MEKEKPNVVLLHGRWPERIEGKLIADIPLCNPNNEGNWMGWTKKQLEEKGYAVTCPIVADAWKAPYEEWKEALDQLVIDESTILVGLSAGGYALLRWLSEIGRNVKKLILVAPASKNILIDLTREKLPHEDEFYACNITPKLKSQIQEQVVIIVSSDDEVVRRSFEVYIPILDAKVVELEGRGHFSFLIPELPELLEEIQR
ncbi:MAG: alpha/beta hydrolase [Candidatus Moranbacteria bacterium]|nr:alpha/beta hydrolase [Candidatus Moranbacteria bacterium]